MFLIINSRLNYKNIVGYVFKISLGPNFGQFLSVVECIWRQSKSSATLLEYVVEKKRNKVELEIVQVF